MRMLGCLCVQVTEVELGARLAWLPPCGPGETHNTHTYTSLAAAAPTDRPRMRTRHALLFLGLGGAAVAAWFFWGRGQGAKAAFNRAKQLLREARARAAAALSVITVRLVSSRAKWPLAVGRVGF